MTNQLKASAVGNIIPFQLELSLKLVIEKWRSSMAPEDERLRSIESTLRQYPYLAEPFTDISRLAAHQDFLCLLLDPLLPLPGWSNTLHSLCAPFVHDVIVKATPDYEKIFRDDHVMVNGLESLMKGISMDVRVLYAYKAILKKFYQLDLKVDLPIIFSSFDDQTGLCRYFKLTGNTAYVEVVNLADLPALDELQLQQLLDQDFDIDSWLTILPPQHFLFSGLTLTTLMDITTEESTKRIQFFLLNREEADEEGWFTSIQQEIRNLFRVPDLRLGLATLQKNRQFNFISTRKIWNSLLIRELSAALQRNIATTFYQQVISTGKALVFENLEDQPDNPLAAALVKYGYRNLLLAPLSYGGQIIGLLELASAEPGAINGLSLFKINQVKPIFAHALNHHAEEFENRVEAVMLQEYTAIHPSIQWRFREAAIHLLDKKEQPDTITFEGVYPFYGSLDIRDSSKQRNRAIFLDLLENLEQAVQLLRLACEKYTLTILEELVFRIDSRIERLRSQFSAEDEGALAELIRQRINPVIHHLGERYPDFAAAAAAYRGRTNAESGIFDRNRLAYDEALARLNRCMADILDEEEEALQRLLPCYFEKYQTDGVEYNIFLGPAIAPDYPFDELYVDNIRLRQLLWTCRIVRQLRPATACAGTGREASRRIDLQIAPLILAYGSCITLKFRMDEKRLDVDGSYNIRYEIVKKRIDKARVQGSGERLSQQDHIALVYTHEKEAQAYRRHFEYLAARGMVEPAWEEMDLEPLPGVKGLKALRVKIL